MFHDFDFDDDGRRVTCTRGVRDPAAGASTDSSWWYITHDDAPPVRLLRVYPGETHREVWETALRHMDRNEKEVLSPKC